VPRPGGLRQGVVAGLLLGAACDGGSLVGPATCTPPEVQRSGVASNPHNVLSAVVTTAVLSADSVVVRFGTSATALENTTPATVWTGDSLSLPVLGLRAETEYSLQTVAYNSCAASMGRVLDFTTGALPTDLPAFSAGGPDPSPGYIVFAAGVYGIVIDNSGRVVWYHRFPTGPGLNFQPQPNGRYAARPAPASGAPAVWVELEPLGAVTRMLPCSGGLQARPHDLLAQPDGSYWILCDDVRPLGVPAPPGSAYTHALGTSVQWISGTSELLFEWAPFDHFDMGTTSWEPTDPTGQVANWTHGNALDIDPDGNLLVSFRNLSEITRIDTRTGNVIWRMGGEHNEFNLEGGAMPPFARQHGVRSLGEGRLLLLDNLGDPSRSSAELYEYDEDLRTLRLSRSYPSSASVVAQLGGNTQGLPGGRVLVSFGSGGSVEEFDAEGRVVWRIEGNPGYIFRAQRIQSLYHPGAGDPR
jgi:hypothetical protein